MYLCACCQSFTPKIHREDAEIKKSVSYRYYITLNNERVQVCKTALCTLLQISFAKINYSSRLLQTGQLPSKRGKHDNRPNRISEERIQLVKEHMGMFHADSSHYSRKKNPNRKYLSCLLNISKMYELYLTTCNEQNHQNPVSANAYRTIFNENVNLGFGSPKTDTCSKCEAATENNQHKELVKKGFLVIAEDKNHGKLPFYYV